MGVTEEAGKVAESAVSAMKSVPLAIALLIVNVSFLGFAAYVLGEVAQNTSERTRAQFGLIEKLVNDIRDCRSPSQKQTYDPTTKSMLFLDSSGNIQRAR